MKTIAQKPASPRPFSSVRAKFAALVLGATLVSCMAVGLIS